MTMVNVALNHVAMARLQGTPIFGRELEVEANGIAFYECQNAVGQRCGQCPICLKVIAEIQVTQELVAEPLRTEIENLSTEVEQLKRDLSGLRDPNAKLSSELDNTNLVIGKLKGALMDAEVICVP